jgi:hypothetical protein
VPVPIAVMIFCSFPRIIIWMEYQVNVMIGKSGLFYAAEKGAGK